VFTEALVEPIYCSSHLQSAEDIFVPKMEEVTRLWRNLHV
jgi:hypothetical protein